VRFGIAEASIAVNVSPVADAVEKDTISLDVIADAVVAHADAPLPDRHVGKPTPLRGVGLELVEHCKHPPMRLGVEPAEIPAEAIRDDQLKA